MKFKSIFIYISCAILGCMYLLALVLSAKLNVSEEYKMYYIKNESNEWFGEGSFDYKLGQTIDFTDSQDRRYLGQGWSNVEEWGTWSNGEKSILLIKCLEDIDNDLKINIEIANFNRDVEGVEIIVNEMLVDSILLNDNSSYTATIPKKAWNNDEKINKIELKYKGQIKSPKEKKISNDTRKIGIGIKSISIDNR